jgi:hypothetical protein
VPLSAWGKGDWRPPEGRVDPAVDMRTAVREQVDRMPVADYFGLLARLMETNPPAAADAPAVARMARVGIVPGRPFDAAKLPQGALDRARGAALERIKAQARELEFRNGWILTTGTGVYGTDYPQRAFVTAIGLGANRPQDAVYPVTHSDGDGRRLNGANRYVLRFPPSETPHGNPKRLASALRMSASARCGPGRHPVAGRLCLALASDVSWRGCQGLLQCRRS